MKVYDLGSAKSTVEELDKAPVDAVQVEVRGTESPFKDIGPDLYRTNAFRVTGLPVDVDATSIRRRIETLEMFKRLKRPDPKPGPLPLDLPPDPNALREAGQKLNDPPRRMIEELFWFWPNRLGGGANDVAFAALARGDKEAAIQMWTRNVGKAGKSAVPDHNLAVLSHALALDMECAATTLSPEEEKVRDDHWKSALTRWNALCNSGAMATRLSKSVVRMRDPRVKAATVERLLASLPLALLSVNAHLAAKAAERGDLPGARRHLDMIGASGFGQSFADQAIRDAVFPLRERARSLCKMAESEADADPIHADSVVRYLVTTTQPVISALDILLPSGHATIDKVRNEVATCALAQQIRYGNSAGNWKISLELLTLILPVAAKGPVQARILENRDIVQDNLRHQIDSGRF